MAGRVKAKAEAKAKGGCMRMLSNVTTPAAYLGRAEVTVGVIREEEPLSQSQANMESKKSQRSISLDNDTLWTRLEVRRMLSHSGKQRSCPEHILRRRKLSRLQQQCQTNPCQVHCPGGDHRSVPFDYYAHPTRRKSLAPVNGRASHECLNSIQESGGTFDATKDYDDDSHGREDEALAAKGFEAGELETSALSDSLSYCNVMWTLTRRFWKTGLIVFLPVLGLPLIAEGADAENNKALRCAYVMILMACFWVTEALPLAITSLLPIGLLPVLGIMTTDAVSKEYMKETNQMFISGIIIAIAVEHCNLHKRIALRIMLLIGTGPRRLMLGFMLPSMILSMWISNTATTAMMVPIVDAVITELEKEFPEQFELQPINEKSAMATVAADRSRPKMRIMMFLSVAYAANTGGTGTLTGTGSNLVLKGVLSEMSQHTPINFANWILFAAPMMFINVFLCWIWLQGWFLGFGTFKAAFQTWRKQRSIKTMTRKREAEVNVQRALRAKYRELGPISFHEIMVFSLFVLLILLWVFRDPKFIRGWGNYVTVREAEYVKIMPDCQSNCTFTREVEDVYAIDDATAGVLVVILLFIIPAVPSLNLRASEPAPALLEWSVVQDRMPWSIVFLLGGGFALAKATDVSGLSHWMGSQLEVLAFMDKFVLVFVICIFTAAATEVTSNVATCSILLPVLRDLSISLRINPLYLMLPATLTCSYAFMLPVATPPNAIVYSASGMKMSDMLKCGFFFNLICVTVNVICLNTYGVWMFQLDIFPDWLSAEAR